MLDHLAHRFSNILQRQEASCSATRVSGYINIAHQFGGCPLFPQTCANRPTSLPGKRGVHVIQAPKITFQRPLFRVEGSAQRL
jgi:hypothetical protein